MKVWDLFIRLFHWSLVVLFCISYLTKEHTSVLHIYSGFFIFVLIVVRLIWGLVGSKYARFSNFLYSPKKVLNYLQELFRKKPKHYIGHNPAAGWMIVVLLISLATITVSGLKVYSYKYGNGLASQSFIELASGKVNVSKKNKNKEYKKPKHFWKEAHEFSVNFTLLLIILHILGVIVSSQLHKENLVKAMISGKKSISEEKSSK